MWREHSVSARTKAAQTPPAATDKRQQNALHHPRRGTPRSRGSRPAISPRPARPRPLGRLRLSPQPPEPFRYHRSPERNHMGSTAVPAFGLSTIGQIGITATDVDRAIAFYRDVLGMKLLFQVPGMGFFDCGGVRLMLSKSEHPG